MRTFEELRELWSRAPARPIGRGVVRRIVARKGGGVHQLLERGEITRAAGLVGDRWALGDSPHPGQQITLIDATVAELIAAGVGPERAGDNLHVELDVGEAALPIGALLRVGTALLEVSPEPHTGCKKFRERFGLEALRWINDRTHASLRLRGLNCQVVGDGAVAVGDVIEVVPRDDLA